MTGTGDPVLREDLGQGVWRLTLNRPERGNALSAEMVQAFDDALQFCLAHEPALLVLQGAGRHFCTGFDLSNLEQESDDSLLARFVRVELLLQRLASAPCATLALAQGRVMGAGADLWVACQWRCMLGDTHFAFPGAGFGLVLGTRRLAAAVGANAARQWVGSGALIDSAQALVHGLATEQAASEQGPAVVARVLARVQRLDPPTRAAIAQVLQGLDSATLAAHDLHQLVLSAARPGLVQRIAHYRASLKKD